MTLATLFDLPPVVPPRRPPEPIFRAADIDPPFRWTASRRWGPGPLCAWLGNNPSDGDGKRDDPSLWRMMGFSFRWGFGGIVVLNVTPYIASQMADVRAWLRSEDNHCALSNARGENIERAAKALQHVDLAVACFGNLPERLDAEIFLEGVILASGRDIDWHCIGTTNSGAPTHPMARGRHRVPDDAKAVRWNADEWLEEGVYH